MTTLALNMKRTMNRSFGIGKNGVTIFQEETQPQDTLGVNGDLYIYRGIKPKLYQKINNKWIHGVSKSITTTNQDYTTIRDDHVILVDTTLNPVTITLSSDCLVEGNELTIKDIGGNTNINNILIVTSGSDKIDNGIKTTIDFPMLSLNLISDGINWYLI